MKATKKSKSGFTLVELMVVAVIVAILAAVAIPLMSGNKNRAAATEAQAAISTIWTAERTHYAEYGAYLDCAAGSIDNLQGINDDDLNGKYFDHEGYSVSGAAGPVMTISSANSTGLGTDNGNVSLAITIADNSSTWGGSLLQ